MGISALSARVSKLEQIIQSNTPPEPWLVFQVDSTEQQKELAAANPDRKVIFVHTVCSRMDCNSCAIVGSYGCRRKDLL